MAAPGLWTPTNTGLTKIANGQFDIDTDTYKIALFTSATNLGVASTTFAGVTNELAAANGYAAGGIAAAMTITTGAATAVSDAVWGTPSGNSVTITSAGNNLPVIQANSMFRVRSHPTAANEGLYFATATSTAGSLSAIKVGSAPVASASSAVNVKLPDTIQIPTNAVWTASGGSLVARYAALYEVAGDVLAYCLLDSAPADVTVTTGNTLTIDSDGTPAPVFSFV
jgi:hypothetical protein